MGSKEEILLATEELVKYINILAAEVDEENIKENIKKSIQRQLEEFANYIDMMFTAWASHVGENKYAVLEGIIKAHVEKSALSNDAKEELIALDIIETIYVEDKDAIMEEIVCVLKKYPKDWNEYVLDPVSVRLNMLNRYGDFYKELENIVRWYGGYGDSEGNWHGRYEQLIWQEWGRGEVGSALASYYRKLKKHAKNLAEELGKRGEAPKEAQVVEASEKSGETIEVVDSYVRIKTGKKNRILEVKDKAVIRIEEEARLILKKVGPGTSIAIKGKQSYVDIQETQSECAQNPVVIRAEEGGQVTLRENVPIEHVRIETDVINLTKYIVYDTVKDHSLTNQDMKNAPSVTDMEEVTSVDMRTRGKEIFNRVEKGEEFLLNKRKKTIGRLVPLQQESDNTGIGITSEQIQRLKMTEGFSMDELEVIGEIIRGKISMLEIVKRLSKYGQLDKKYK